MHKISKSLWPSLKETDLYLAHGKVMPKPVSQITENKMKQKIALR